jgi:hypothetical protein
MRIARQILLTVLIALVLLSLVAVLRHPPGTYYDVVDEPIYTKGNAAESVRSEILAQLYKFQNGYTRRDKDQVDTFMEALFSREDLLVLGTMPDEVYIGSDEVSDLIYADWNAWGDCTFLMDRAHISTIGDVAWISTVGYVEFDLSRHLVLPLRLSAVMVKEEAVWKFRSMQFQFDLSLFPLFLAIPLLTVILSVSLISLVVTLVQSVRGRRQTSREFV